MQLWKPLLVILPAGLVLGAIGGHFARPVMQTAADAATDPALQTRAERRGSADTFADTSEPTPYTGGYSYAPALASGDPPEWSNRYDRSVAYAGPPLPTISELDARTDALLASSADAADVSADGYGKAAAAAAQAQQAVAAARGAAASPAEAKPAPPLASEPSSGNGNLPAIW